jgi:hypothetical protein
LRSRGYALLSGVSLVASIDSSIQAIVTKVLRVRYTIDTCGVARIYASGRHLILWRWVNKQHQARFGLRVSDEHARAKPVRGGLEAGLGIHVLWPTL